MSKEQEETWERQDMANREMDRESNVRRERKREEGLEMSSTKERYRKVEQRVRRERKKHDKRDTEVRRDKERLISNSSLTEKCGKRPGAGHRRDTVKLEKEEH